ncbi:GNAT family N-acetyltransferase [Roseovarius sp. M141]|uniref:GNAT family N-acetyltransferase n=1 Tax=Roseovarius sp. M141 TaxID=2583806 RepID=UPI0020CBB489
MTVSIRYFRPEDAAALARVMHAAIHANGDYTRAQRSAWSPRAMPSDAFLARVSDGRNLWVAQDQHGAPVGFVELTQGGYIDCFYCDPAGQGTGSALYKALESDAMRAGHVQLTVNASEAARRFFLRRGFADIGRQQVQRRGVTLHNYAMTKTLP